MNIFRDLRAVAAILYESFKLLPRNGRLFTLIALTSAILYSSLSLFLYNMLVKQYNLDLSSGYSISNSVVASEGTTYDYQTIFPVSLTFIIGIYAVSFFSTITVVIISAASYSNKTLSVKEFVLEVSKSWIRPLITSFYTTLLANGYLFMVTITITYLLILSTTYIVPIAIIVIIIACIFYVFLNVIWVLALVVSSIEENNYGIQAISRAQVLMEGKKLQGFILNVSISLLSLILSMKLKVILGKIVIGNQIVVWISASVISSLMEILLSAAYTVLYFHCKEDHGEEMELQGSFHCKKLSTEPLLSDAT